MDASVLDPLDRMGYKNLYISTLRDRAIVDALGPPASENSTVLDFGSGTGSLSAALIRAGYGVLGVDISHGLLARTAERELGDHALFVQYDGSHLPLADASMDAASTYVVLNHLTDDDLALTCLREIRRVLKPGGRFVAMEQVRCRRTFDSNAWQVRRTVEEFVSLFEAAGFRIDSKEVRRYGHFPTTFILRYGLIPSRIFPLLQRVEQAVGALLGPIPGDYSDMLFCVVKR
jgi:ubiquinone/menaquinone biosynthesis C-methylase UbiE